MAQTFVCKNCHKEEARNIRLKGHQEYCSAVACQRTRKKAWQQKKMADDAQYRDQQQDCLRQWRKERPLYVYQKQYRQEHPAYVVKNRKQQIRRNHKQAVIASLFRIVKMDASTPVHSMNYLINPQRVPSCKKIVKMDALIMQITVLNKDIKGVDQLTG
jgi:hypothetical protein